jgi:hypothetical protein
MNRSLFILNLVLAAAFASLLVFDLVLEARSDEARRRESAFLQLAPGLSPEAVARLELEIRESETWTYERRAEGWRIPKYRDAYALSQPIDGILRAFLESHGTEVGSLPALAEHFGLTSGGTLKVTFQDGRGKRLLRAFAGNVAPGQRSSECYMAAAGESTILHMHSNPWAYIDWTPESRFPPLIDLRVVPVAQGRGSIARIIFEDVDYPPFLELIRREAPAAGRLPFGPDQGPRFEWFGAPTLGGPEVRVNDNAAFAYAGFLAGLTFEELAGAVAGRESLFAKPALSLTLHYDGGATDKLVLAERKGPGPGQILNATTGQVFLISEEKVAGLLPAEKTFLEPPPAPREE